MIRVITLWHIVIAAAFVNLLGCGKATPDGSVKVESVSVERPKVQDNRPTSNDAVQFIVSRMSPQQVGSGNWLAQNFEISTPQWRWLEASISTSGKDAMERLVMQVHVKENYSVLASELNIPVIVSGSRVTFECSRPGCISVESETSVPAVDGGKDPVRSVETRNKNTWHFGSADEAQRVSNALNILLENFGAQKTKF